MRTAIIIIAVAMAGILMVTGSLPAAELGADEAEILEMFSTFNELETHFRNSDWEGAERVVEKVESEYLELAGRLKGKVNAKLLKKFAFLMRGFRKAMSRRHAEDMEKPYMQMQSLFLDIMGQFDYPTPPSLMLVDLYVEEAREFLEKGDLHQVAEEMEEIEFFRHRAVNDAWERKMDVKSLEGLFDLCEEVNGLAEGNGSREKIGSMLKEMDSIISRHVK